MNRRLVAVLIAVCAFAACKRPSGEAPASMPAMNQDAIKALGRTVPEPGYDRAYWLKQHDADTAEWHEAKRLCEQTVLASYLNCLPLNDIVQADRRKKAQEEEKAAAKNDEMFRRGYQYDFARKSWLPFRQLMAAGCISVPAYPNDQRRIGLSTWKCPQDMTIPNRIQDPQFRQEEEHATD